MSADMISIIERQLDAYNRGDLDAFIACYTPQVELYGLIDKAWFVRGD